MSPKVFGVGGVTVELGGVATPVVHKLLSHFFALGAAAEQDNVKLQLHAEPLPDKFGHTVYQAEALTVTRHETGFNLSCGASQLQITPGKARAHCFLAPDFDTHSPFEQREFFLLGLLMLLRPCGRYGLHARGLERDGTGLLLVGSSGSGKTTTSLTLIRQGWQYLSDDAVLLSHEQNHEQRTVKVSAFRQGFSCTPETLKHFPELNGSREFGDPGGKRIVYLENSFTPTCTPSLLVFPRVTAEDVTHLRPLTSAQRLIRLCQQSAGTMTDVTVSQGQLELLRTLVRQTRSFVLCLGRDALAHPDLTDSLLSQVLENRLEETPCVSSSN